MFKKIVGQTFIDESNKLFNMHISGSGFLILTALWASIIEFFTNIQLGIVFCLSAILIIILVDVVTGVWSAQVRGDAVTSNRLKRGMSEKLVTALMVVIGCLVVDVILVHIFGFKKTYALGIFTILTLAKEMFSIVENLNKIFPENQMLHRVLRVFNQSNDRIGKAIDDGKIIDAVAKKVGVEV